MQSACGWISDPICAFTDLHAQAAQVTMQAMRRLRGGRPDSCLAVLALFFLAAAHAVCMWLDIRSYLSFHRSAHMGRSRADASNAAAQRWAA